MKKIKISLKNQARNRMLRNQISSLILSGSVQTTLVKAKFLKKEASSFFAKFEKLDDLEKSKFSHKVLYGPAIKKVMDEKYGAISLFKLSNRFGDSAEMARVTVEIMTNKVEKEDKKIDKEQKTKKEKAK